MNISLQWLNEPKSLGGGVFRLDKCGIGLWFGYKHSVAFYWRKPTTPFTMGTRIAPNWCV